MLSPGSVLPFAHNFLLNRGRENEAIGQAPEAGRGQCVSRPGLALSGEAAEASGFQRATLTESSGVFKIDLNIQYRSLQQNSWMRNNVNPLPLIS